MGWHSPHSSACVSLRVGARPRVLAWHLAWQETDSAQLHTRGLATAATLPRTDPGTPQVPTSAQHRGARTHLS